MNLKALAKADLNLLVALYVLLEERSVSAAAKRLSITQPAMSKTLARLRNTFDDPLFVRSKRGVHPTPRAESVGAELKPLLSKIETLLHGEDFTPVSYRGEIQIAISEYVGISLLPPLSAKLQQLAPKLRLKTITRVENQLHQLATGDLDFAIQLSRRDYPKEYRYQSLGNSPLGIFVRRDHPLIGQVLTRDNLSYFPSINLYISDRMESPQLPELPAMGERVGMLETSHLLTALEVLRETDYTLICPAYLARNEGATRDVVALPLPTEDAQSVDYTLVAHERTRHSAIHQWLWNEILDTVRNMRIRTVHRG